MSDATGTVGEGSGDVRTSAWAVAILCAGAGVLLVGTLERTGVTLGVLLLVAALAGLAVAVGSAPAGAGEGERAPSGSVRLALGALGGALGGLAAVGVVGLVELLGLPEAAGSALPARLSSLPWLAAAGEGAVWGAVLGILLPRLPGRDAVGRGLLFSLIPALWVLVKVYPRDLDVGVFGWKLGPLTFLFVLLYHLAWGATVGATMRWGETSEESPLDRPIVE